MKISDKDQQAPYYSKTNSQFRNTMSAIINYRFDKGYVHEDELSVSQIIFMLKGSCRITFGSIKNLLLPRSNAILLPAGFNYHAVMEENSHIFICKIVSGMQLCEMFSLKNLFPEKKKVKKTFAMLHMNERLWSYVDHTVKCMEQGAQSPDFLQTKATELMYMFRAYYSKETLTEFFYIVLNDDMEFALTVFENCMDVKSKTELAALTNLSPSRFGAKFKQVFGVSPYKWLLDRKSEKIYYELSNTDKPLKQISTEYNFSSVQHFNDFCKKQFNLTPGQIRSPVPDEQS